MEEIATRPRVSALIVSRNSAASLRRCLEALEKSTDRELLEILVVDNGSTDGTASVADDFPAVTVLKLPKNFGRAKALNIGLRTAKGDLVLLMDPTIEVQPETIPRLAARILEDDNIAAVCPYVETVYPLPPPAALKSAWGTGMLPDGTAVDANAAEIVVDYPKGAPMLVRRLFLQGMNYFDQRFGEHWTDLELCWQIRSAGKKILVMPPVRVDIVLADSIDPADSAAGISAYLGKHYGTAAALQFKMLAVLQALTRGRFGLVADLLSGQKIDGTQ